MVDPLRGVLSELIAWQLETEVFEEAAMIVHGDDVEQAFEALRQQQRVLLPHHAEVPEVPDYCSACDRTNLSLRVFDAAGLASKTISFRLHQEQVSSYAWALEAAEKRSLLVELKRPSGDTVPVIGKVSHEQPGHPTIRCQYGGQVWHLDAEAWKTETFVAWSVSVILTARQSNYPRLRQTYTPAEVPLADAVPSDTMPTTDKKTRDGSDPAPDEAAMLAMEEVDCCEVVGKVLQQVTLPDEVARVQDLCGRVIGTEDSEAHSNLAIRQPSGESKVVFKAIPSPNGPESTLKKAFERLRKVCQEADRSLTALTDMIVSASLDSPGECWRLEALQQLSRIPQVSDRNILV